MGSPRCANHPVAWCKDFQGGRSFYTGARQHRRRVRRRRLRKHLEGAVDWAAGKADPVYSDCGATVLTNYQQTKISAPPNLNEPIGFDQLPDGRIIQTARVGPGAPARPGDGHDDADHRRRSPSTRTQRGRPVRPGGRQQLRHQQVGVPLLLAAAPSTASSTATARRSRRTTPAGALRTDAPQADPSAWDTWTGYFQLSRFKFVDDAGNPSTSTSRPSRRS